MQGLYELFVVEDSQVGFVLLLLCHLFRFLHEPGIDIAEESGIFYGSFLYLFVFESVPKTLFDERCDFQKVDLEASGVLEVLFACLGHFLTFVVLGIRLHTRAEQGLATEEGGVKLAMREHNHVAIVVSVALLTVLVLGLFNQAPVSR